MIPPVLDARYAIVGETPREKFVRVCWPTMRTALRALWRLVSVLVWLLIFTMFIARAGGFGKQFWHDVQCQNAADQKTAYCQSRP